MKRQIYSVGQVNGYLKNLFREDFLLPNLCVRGEVSNCKYHSSGHLYFTLKDGGSALAAVMFARDCGRLRFRLRDGDKVIVTGSVEVYERDGKYQLYARDISQEGEGDLYVRFRQLKESLSEMGMFAQEYKQKIPAYAKRIGIVTSPTGAAVRDIIQVSRRRNPYVELILYPALVQGEGALQSVIDGIRCLDAMHLDILIVGRGGGSIEDLWTFNEEALAREIFACGTPVISAVGHETDETIADMVADLRAPTPSAAAELAVFSYEEACHRMCELRGRMQTGMQARLSDYRSRAKHFERRLQIVSPERTFNERRQYIAQLQQRLEQMMKAALERKGSRLKVAAERLDGLSPAKRLAMGYAYIADAVGVKVTRASQVEKNDLLQVYLREGRLTAQVLEKDEDMAWKN